MRPRETEIDQNFRCVNVAKVFFTNCHLFNMMSVTKMWSLKCYINIRRQQTCCSEYSPNKQCTTVSRSMSCHSRLNKALMMIIMQQMLSVLFLPISHVSFPASTSVLGAAGSEINSLLFDPVTVKK